MSNHIKKSLGIYTKNSRGVTLIELLIVVAIIAILGGIGYPMYAEQVRKARRGDAQGALYALQNAMEQHAARNPNTGYAGAATGGADDGAPDNPVFPYIEAPMDGQDKYYDLTIDATVAAGYGESYILSAAPKGKMDGDACGTFTLTNTGVRAVSGAGSCWK